MRGPIERSGPLAREDTIAASAIIPYIQNCINIVRSPLKLKNIGLPYTPNEKATERNIPSSIIERKLLAKVMRSGPTRLGARMGGAGGA
jgi:hypothetical protein